MKKIGNWFEQHLLMIPILTGLVALFAILAIGLIGMCVSTPFFTTYNNVFQGISTGVSAVVTAVLVGIIIMQTITLRKQAEEMREQRYDAVRPVIDIVIIEQSITSREGLLQAYGANPKDLPCKLRNIGVGPAIAVHSFIEDIHDPDGNPRRWDFGNFPSAAGKMEYTQEMPLLLLQKDNQRALVAYYEDVYGNRFESIREVNVHEVVRSRGPIKIRKIAKEEFPK